MNVAVLNVLNNLKNAEMDYRKSKRIVAKKEASLYAHTDFKELKLSNKEQREGWITDHLIPLMDEEKFIEKQVEYNHLSRLFKALLEAPNNENQFDSLIELFNRAEDAVEAGK